MTTATSQPNQQIGPTRREVAAAIGGAFGAGAVHRDQIIASARGAGARREVVELLERLPSYRYHQLEQVWDHLPRF